MLYMMIGVPGSGKSTYASSLGLPIVSTDAIREELFGDANEQSNGNIVFKVAYERLHNYIDNGQDVIFDAMNVKRAYRKSILKEFNCPTTAIILDTPLNICSLRNSKRERKVPEDVIERNYHLLKDNWPSKEEGFSKVVIICSEEE